MLDPNSITTTSCLPFQASTKYSPQSNIGNLHSILLSGPSGSSLQNCSSLKDTWMIPKRKKHFSRAKHSFSWWTKCTKEKITDFQQNTAWKDHNHIPLYERICVQPLKTFVRTPLLCIQHVAKIIVICSDHNPPWFVDEIPTLMFFTLFYQWVVGNCGCQNQHGLDLGGHCVKRLQSGQVIITTPRLEISRFLCSIFSCLHGSCTLVQNIYPPRYHLSHFELLPTIRPLQLPGNLGSSAMIPGSCNKMLILLNWTERELWEIHT